MYFYNVYHHLCYQWYCNPVVFSFCCWLKLLVFVPSFLSSMYFSKVDLHKMEHRFCYEPVNIELSYSMFAVLSAYGSLCSLWELVLQPKLNYLLLVLLVIRVLKVIQNLSESSLTFKISYQVVSTHKFKSKWKREKTSIIPVLRKFFCFSLRFKTKLSVILGSVNGTRVVLIVRLCIPGTKNKGQVRITQKGRDRLFNK